MSRWNSGRILVGAAKAQASAPHPARVLNGVDQQIVDAETDARFWLRTNYKSGQKLNPKDQADRMMVPVWILIHEEVKAEALAGKLALIPDGGGEGSAHPAADFQADLLARGQHPEAFAAATQAPTAPSPAHPTHGPAHPTHGPAHAPTAVISPPPSVLRTSSIAQTETTRGKVLGFTPAQIAAETDARFWAQTGYKPGKKLNPAHDATDAKMARVWLDVQRKVAAQAKAGTLVLTYDHPIVSSALDRAEIAHDVTVAQLAAAAAAPTAEIRDVHLDDARAADAARQQAAAQASAIQPPTASPVIASIAAAEVVDSPSPPPSPASADPTTAAERALGQAQAQAAPAVVDDAHVAAIADANPGAAQDAPNVPNVDVDGAGAGRFGPGGTDQQVTPESQTKITASQVSPFSQAELRALGAARFALSPYPYAVYTMRPISGDRDVAVHLEPFDVDPTTPAPIQHRYASASEAKDAATQAYMTAIAKMANPDSPSPFVYSALYGQAETPNLIEDLHRPPNQQPTITTEQTITHKGEVAGIAAGALFLGLAAVAAGRKAPKRPATEAKP